MDFAYNDEQKELIRVVRDLVEKEIVPYASEMDETGKLHEGLLEKLAAQGLLGVAIPEEFGGAGLDAVTIAGIYEELGKGCAGVATTVAATRWLLTRLSSLATTTRKNGISISSTRIIWQPSP